jgi:hypothetical protein
MVGQNIPRLRNKKQIETIAQEIISVIADKVLPFLFTTTEEFSLHTGHK